MLYSRRSTFSRKNQERLDAIKAETGMDKTEILSVLLDIYELNDLDGLMEQIQKMARKGFQPKVLRQLSVLHTQLATLLKPSL